MADVDASIANLARDIQLIKAELMKIITFIHDAESEVPEHVRRFVQYMHDTHAISYMYEERGLPVPLWIRSEMERCDDRFRQLQKRLHTDGGAFEKIRREMADDKDNRWDHTRQLSPPNKEMNGEARPSK